MKLFTFKDFYPLSVIALIQLANWACSAQLRLFLVKAVASVAHRLSTTKRRLSEKNVSEVFGGKLSQERVRTVVKSSFYEFWFEVFFMPPSISGVPFSRCDIRGLEHLQRAIDAGRGAILWESSHFGRRLLAKSILCQKGFAVNQVHGEYHMGGLPNNRSFVSWTREHFIRRFFENCEKPFIREIIYLTSPQSLAFPKILLKLLKQNGIICISADVKRGHKIIPVPFLGRTEGFPTGVVSLAKLSGATILPLFCIKENGTAPSLIIEPPVRLETDVDRESDLKKTVIQFASLLDSYIMKYPEQYRDWHSLPAPLRPVPQAQADDAGVAAYPETR